MRRSALALVFVALAGAAGAAFGTTILFVGNSFTYGYGSSVRFFRAESVTDLNREGVGGVPALFKAFTAQAGLDYDVHLETHGDVGLDWHLENKRAVLGQKPWDIVVLQSYSTLDPKKQGDPELLIRSSRRMVEFLQGGNASVDVRLVATWPRADLVYGSRGAWHGKTLEAMAADVRAGNDQAAAASSAIKGVVPSGEAWVRAIRAGIADANPYDGIDAGKLNLWTFDNHHASVYGYYLDALVLFGAITGRDPRSLGGGECAGFELGLSRPQAEALQRVAYEQLAGAGPLASFAPSRAAPGGPHRCARGR